MFELLTIVLFVWLMVKVVGLIFKLTWGTAKILAGMLTVIALPLLVICLLFVGGIALLLPLGMVAIAFAIVKSGV